MTRLRRFVSVLLVVTLTIGMAAAPATAAGAEGDAADGDDLRGVIVDAETGQVAVVDSSGEVVETGEDLRATMERSGLFTEQEIERADAAVPDEVGVATSSDCVFVPIVIGVVIPCAEAGASVNFENPSASAGVGSLAVFSVAGSDPFFFGAFTDASVSADTSETSATVDSETCVRETNQINEVFCVPVSANPG